MRWARAVAKTKTIDAKTVVAELETYKREPTSLGPRSFSKDLHIQAALPLVINQITEGTGKVVATADVPEIPRDVLYRLKK